MMTKKEEKCLMESLEQDVQNSNKHKIDWEQRRYEIAKECLPCVYQMALEIAKRTGTIEKPQRIAAVTVDLADLLIDELKKDKE